MGLATIDRPIAIRQTMKAGGNFSGSAPSDGGVPLSPTLADDIFKFAEGDVGGLFDFTNAYYAFESRGALELLAVELTLNDQSSWKLEHEDVDGNLVTVYSGTTDATFVATGEKSLVLLWGSKLLLTTVGATGAMTGSIVVAPYRWPKR